MSGDRGVNEWNLLREQFHALVREGSDSIEDIFDAQFRSRFGELIKRAAEREHIKSAALPHSNLALHLRKYTAHRNLPKKAGEIVFPFETGRGQIAAAVSRTAEHLIPMSAFGPKRTCEKYAVMVAFGGKADINFCRANVRYRPKADAGCSFQDALNFQLLVL